MSTPRAISITSSNRREVYLLVTVAVAKITFRLFRLYPRYRPRPCPQLPSGEAADTADSPRYLPIAAAPWPKAWLRGAGQQTVRLRPGRCYLWIMPRHETVTDEYVDGLRASLRAQAAAPNRQGLVNTGAYPYLVALRHVDQGWTRDKIAEELAVAIVTGRLRGTFNVIGEQ